MTLTLEYIKSCVENFASKINAPHNLLPTYGKSFYGPTSYINIDDKGRLSYVVPGDRGNETYIEAVDLNHLLYIIFQSITNIMAMNLVANESSPNVDSRRRRLQIQLDLLEKLNTEWKIKEEERQRSIEIRAPFTDYEGQRKSYIRELLGNGYLYDEAIKKANEKYP